MLENRLLRGAFALLFTLALPIGGCASSSTSSNGETSGSYPAFKPDIGQVVKNGNVVIASPKIVTVTWSADANAAALEEFGDKLGSSAYWQTTAGEYDIKPAVSGAANHVRIADAAPATIDRDALNDLIIDRVSKAPAGGWPAYDVSTIYVVYIPTMTTITPSGPYHSETAVGANEHVPFVVIDENDHGSKSVMDAVTEASSHEIIETATNPHVLADPPAVGILGFDTTHIAWQMTTGDPEIGDLCEDNADAVFKGPADLPYSLQRLWSNKSALAGHNPCVPAPAEPYYNVTPLELETVGVIVDTATAPTNGLGYRVPIGQQKTIKLGFYSDAPTSGPWTITVAEGSLLAPESHRLTVTVTQGSGKNGDTGSITVAANAQSTGAGNAVLLTVTSQAAGLAKHSVPILIGTY